MADRVSLTVDSSNGTRKIFGNLAAGSVPDLIESAGLDVQYVTGGNPDRSGAVDSSIGAIDGVAADGEAGWQIWVNQQRAGATFRVEGGGGVNEPRRYPVAQDGDDVLVKLST